MTDTKISMGRALGLALVVALGAVGCDHMTDPIDGPRLIDRFGDFSVLEPFEASRSEVDFAAGEDVVFTATFNKQVDWVVEITGQESGAVKRIEGFSNELTAENARWEGGTTDLPFFKMEPVDVALLVDEENADTLRASVEVLAPKMYEGDVVTGFEPEDDADIVVGNFEFEFDPSSGLSAEVPPAEGEAFYLLRGTDIVVNNFFVGLIDITPDGDGYFEVPTTVPQDLYLNAFLYSFGTPNTIAVIQVIADANGSGAFEDGQDDVFVFLDSPVDWSGWEHVFLPLSETGISQAQAQQIVAIRVLLISDNNSQPTPPLPVDFGVDYITFTAGDPLQL